MQEQDGDHLAVVADYRRQLDEMHRDLQESISDFFGKIEEAVWLLCQKPSCSRRVALLPTRPAGYAPLVWPPKFGGKLAVERWADRTPAESYWMPCKCGGLNGRTRATLMALVAAAPQGTREIRL